jgi:hypothetical protein
MPERPVRSKDRVGLGRRHVGDNGERLGVLGLAAAAKIVLSVRRICADNHKIRSLAQPLMAGAGRQHHDVAGHYIDRLAIVAAEAHLGAAARHRHRFVDHRVIVHVGIDPVAP